MVEELRPFLDYGALGVALAIMGLQLAFFAYMTKTMFTWVYKVLPSLEAVKGACATLVKALNDANDLQENRGRGEDGA